MKTSNWDKRRCTADESEVSATGAAEVIHCAEVEEVRALTIACEEPPVVLESAAAAAAAAAAGVLRGLLAPE